MATTARAVVGKTAPRFGILGMIALAIQPASTAAQQDMSARMVPVRYSKKAAAKAVTILLSAYRAFVSMLFAAIPPAPPSAGPVRATPIRQGLPALVPTTTTEQIQATSVELELTRAAKMAAAVVLAARQPPLWGVPVRHQRAPAANKAPTAKMTSASPTIHRVLPFARAAVVPIRFVLKMEPTIFAHRAAPTRQMIAPI